MYNKCVLIFLLASDFVSFFLLCLNASSLQRHKGFLFYEKTKEKIHKTKTTEWHNELKSTANKLKMKNFNTYLNHFNKRKLMFRRKLGKLFFSFFWEIVKSICEHQHNIFSKSTAPAKIWNNNLRSAASRFAHSAVCGNTYTSPPFGFYT